MSVKIGLLSDVHATPEPLRQALTILRNEGVETILCAGDIAGYGSRVDLTAELLSESNCRTIAGNHDLWWLERSKVVAEQDGSVAFQFLRALPPVLELSIAGKELYMVHASPPLSVMEGIKLRDEEGLLIPEQIKLWSERLQGFSFDVLVVGHTHQVFAEKLGDLLVINPGSTRYNHTCMTLTLPEMTVEVHPLGGKKPAMVWNWGIEALLQMEGKKARNLL